MRLTDFERFRQEVLGDPFLQDDLRNVDSTEEFIEKVMKTGRQRGFEFRSAEVAEAIRAGQEQWALRWL